MRSVVILFFSLIFLVFSLSAQSFQLHGHMQGGCSITIIGQANEKPNQWEGLWFSERDTFYWEGITQGDTLLGFIAVKDDIAGQFFIRPYAGDIWTGAWKSRIHSTSYPLFLRERPLEEWEYHFLKTTEGQSSRNQVHVSRISRGQWRGQVWNVEQSEWDDFDWLRGLGHSGPPEINEALQAWEQQDSLREGFPLQVYRYCNPSNLTEISFPNLPYPLVADSLNRWRINWKTRLDHQLDSLQGASTDVEKYETLWKWKAYAFVEIYVDAEKLLSFTIHSRDFSGHTEVESWHYLPHKSRFTSWKDQTRRTDKLFRLFKQKAGKEAAWIFHNLGAIAVHPAQKGGGIKTQFIPHDDIKGHYRWFSSFRSLRQ